MPERLQNKVAIITGAATGIGEAIAHKFAVEGASIMLAGLPEDPLEDTVEQIQFSYDVSAEKLDFHKGDLANPQEAQECIDETISKFGQLDILINNAGVFLYAGPTEEYPQDKFEQTIDANIKSAFYMTRAALPHLQNTQGCIISAGSESGQLGLANNTAYGGTKGWMHAFMKGVAVEQGKYGIRANCVCPGPIDTGWTHKESGPMSDEMEQMVTKATIFGRRGTPEEVANVYAFLASDEASYVTGALYNVDGGTTIAKGPAGDEAKEAAKTPPQGRLKLSHSRDGLKNKDYDEAA